MYRNSSAILIAGYHWRVKCFVLSYKFSSPAAANDTSPMIPDELRIIIWKRGFKRHSVFSLMHILIFPVFAYYHNTTWKEGEEFRDSLPLIMELALDPASTIISVRLPAYLSIVTICHANLSHATCDYHNNAYQKTKMKQGKYSD